jgi:hypothetical protein
LNLADQQLIIGLLILVSAVIRYVPTSDFFNLAITGDTAAFSAITHLASLRTLRPYLRQRFRMTICRLIIVAVTNITVVIIVIITATVVGIRNFSVISVTYSWLLVWLSYSIILSIFLSGLALAARIAIQPSMSRPSDIELRINSLRMTDSNGTLCTNKNPITAVAVRVCHWYLAASPGPKIFSAYLLELIFAWRLLSVELWLMFALTLGSLVSDMAYSGLVSSWGFGQLLPTILIILPFFTLVETYGGIKLSFNIHQATTSNLFCKKKQNGSQKTKWICRHRHVSLHHRVMV